MKVFLSNLQSNNGQCRQQDCGNPEAYGDFRFVPRPVRPFAEHVAALGVELRGQHAEVVVDRRALEDAALLAFLFP